MLILRKSKEGVVFPFKFRGANIKLKIRPADPDKFDSISKEHTKADFVKDPDNRHKLVKVMTPDSGKIFEDMVDYSLESFEGVGYGPNEPLEVTRENKILLVGMKPFEGEQTMWDFILEKSNALRTIRDEELQGEAGN